MGQATSRRNGTGIISSIILTAAVLAASAAAPARAGDAPLPEGVKAVWDMGKAFHQTTPTREAICINGLWRWQPAKGQADAVPADQWGFFKVPGCWPGVGDYMQKDCQTVHANAAWKDEKFGGVAAAWYQREIAIPDTWTGRRIVLTAEYVNSYAAVFVDGKKAGDVRFPGGEVDLTAACKPGAKCVLSMYVLALPLKEVVMSYGDTNTPKVAKGSVNRRGLCGDLFLVGDPTGPRIADVKVDTSVRKGEISFAAAPTGLAAGKQYVLRALVTDAGKKAAEFAGKPFTAADLKAGPAAFTAAWKPEKLWDIHTPGNVYEAQVSILEGDKVLDTAAPVRFGFREFWIDGRDFYLNGTRLFLSAVPLDNAQVGAEWASYAATVESLKRLKTFGINFVYTHNYGCEPGSHLSFTEILRAADDAGMLVALSQPHFGQYDWKAADADAANGYARHATFYVGVARNHPSVVAYSMSHNATGYGDDMNPDKIDGLPTSGTAADRGQWSINNVTLAQRAEAIVKAMDPQRIVYHHSSGNLSSMHTSNFYPNWAPIQEMSDWFEHFSKDGVKPCFLVEYGAPFTWDWAMYRGWYNGKRNFGSAAVPWELCFAEWNAQFLGDRAFLLGEQEKADLRWENKQFQAGKVWHRWDYPVELGSPLFEDRHAVMGMYIADNWRAFRTWGLSANSPWEHGHFWRLRAGMSRNTLVPTKVDWDDLQRPGYSADFLRDRYERMDMAYELTDWVPTADAQALYRNNMPVLGYIAGPAGRVTTKDHNFRPGEAVAKQLLVINNSRLPVACQCDWSLALPTAITGTKKVTVQTGQQEAVPLDLALPAGVAPGKYELTASFLFDGGVAQKDTFTVHVLPPSPAATAGGAGGTAKIALFDPKGQTAKLLADLGVTCKAVEAGADLSAFETLIVGKAALTVDGPGPDLARVRDGLKVIVFEQQSPVLEKRLGFRVVEYGLRQVFPRIADHPLLAGVGVENLRDWRGEATILPPRLKYESHSDQGPTIKWCGIDVTRVWRCGSRGNVASVLIEKPTRGDFLPIVDGGFSLQYSPLMEYREGKGMVLFCQLDVTGRTLADPAAEAVTRNILQYVAAWKPPATAASKAVYAGDPAGKRHLEAVGAVVAACDPAALPAGGVLIVAPGAGKDLAAQAAGVQAFLKAGGRVLAIGLDQQEATAFLPTKVAMADKEHIASTFDPPGVASPLAGVGPADVHNRDPKVMPLVTDGATVVGDGVLATAEDGRAVFCQLVPWQLEYAKQFNLKRTFRRSSFLLTRLMGNLGVPCPTALLARFHDPVSDPKAVNRCLDGLYLDKPEELDDPYRFFRW